MSCLDFTTCCYTLVELDYSAGQKEVQLDIWLVAEQADIWTSEHTGLQAAKMLRASYVGLID